ncbi:MAG: response regulator transcription factor [Haloechinothrix sp.]
MSEPIDVVLADDSYLVREGVRRLLEDCGAVRVLAGVGSASDLLDAVSRLRHRHPHFTGLRYGGHRGGARYPRTARLGGGGGALAVRRRGLRL